jgi:steroid 5-alpha reductase family enzyme
LDSFWTGNLITSINVYNGLFQLFIILLGYMGIVFVMFSGARRIEIHQNKNYGNDKEYKEYIKKTPILVPFFPLKQKTYI